MTYIKKQRKSPENGDWKINHRCTVMHSIFRNKENLLKMEIERHQLHQLILVLFLRKQRKSPENGDWKLIFMFGFLLLINCGNKENLLKMEIESRVWSGCFCYVRNQKQRKSPENGDWKSTWTGDQVHIQIMKQRKSPENGDWKAGTCFLAKAKRMQETKKISWKWRLKDFPNGHIECGYVGETKKISWKWRLKDKKVRIFPASLQYETKKISWKWRLKVIIALYGVVSPL